VQLVGKYTLDGKTFEFTGNLRTKARVSQMVQSSWKSLLLKAVDPFFAKHGAGTEVPVKISGTNTEPKFGVDWDRMFAPKQETRTVVDTVRDGHE